MNNKFDVWLEELNEEKEKVHKSRVELSKNLSATATELIRRKNELYEINNGRSNLKKKWLTIESLYAVGVLGLIALANMLAPIASTVVLLGAIVGVLAIIKKEKSDYNKQKELEVSTISLKKDIRHLEEKEVRLEKRASLLYNKENNIKNMIISIKEDKRKAKELVTNEMLGFFYPDKIVVVKNEEEKPKKLIKNNPTIKGDVNNG